MSTGEKLRQLPSVDEVAQSLTAQLPDIPRPLLISEIRKAIDAARKQLRNGSVASLDIEADVFASIDALRASSLRHVINATGVVLHTNLGRAPSSFLPILSGYSNLEYDLRSGKRGKRDSHVGPLLERLLGKPAIVVNNNAAAVYLVLNELAAGAEVIVSRGQLIEIGDGFRIPDIMQRAGVILREVGTTNRTNIEDFRNAINDRTRLMLIVHPSNFRIEGFTSQPSHQEMVALSREANIPIFEDAGSGCLIDLSAYGVTEPLVANSLRDGIQIVSFSGDKLLGGPQAGIITGDADLIGRIRRNPMFRAFRLDKLILESLEEHLRALLLGRLDDIPALRMIRLTAEQLRQRCETVVAKLHGIDAIVIGGESVIGGGSTPAQSLPTALIAINSHNPVALEQRLRQQSPPVVARIEADVLLLDLRTVFEEEEPMLISALHASTSAIER